MSFLRIKSKENEKATDLLITNCFYASSVHCSYYSCVQLMSDRLINSIGWSESKVDEQADSQLKTTHNIIINAVKTFLLTEHRFKGRDFNKKIIELKKLRNKSDYKNVEITEKISIEAKNKSLEINKILDDCLKDINI